MNKMTSKTMLALFAIWTIWIFHVPPSIAQGANPSAFFSSDLNVALMGSTYMLTGTDGNEQGTAFLLSKPTKRPGEYLLVLVTAAHVLDSIPGDQAIIVLRGRVNGKWTALPTGLQIRSNGHNLWKHLPDSDVAAANLTYLAGTPGGREMGSVDIRALATDEDLMHYQINPGVSVSSIGFPLAGTSRNTFPILRSGIIASFPLAPQRDYKSFVVDLRVLPGDSGSPIAYVRSDVDGPLSHLSAAAGLILGVVLSREIGDQLKNKFLSNKFADDPLELANVANSSQILATTALLPERDSEAYFDYKFTVGMTIVNTPK